MKDRFSGYASRYAAFRPKYPSGLFDFVFDQVRSFDLAWDAGTGNGQAAEVLATKFRKVLATDISQKQLEQAAKKENIVYELAGEATSLTAKSVDLVTVAQAIHWFDRKRFYDEVNRAAKPGAVIAAWAYGLLKLSPAIEPLVERFYGEVVGPFWDPERKLIDERLATIEFPFEQIPSPEFSMRFTWSLSELEGYLGTWSATQRYIAAHQFNPVIELMDAIMKLQTADKLSVEFPLYLRIGRV